MGQRVGKFIGVAIAAVMTVTSIVQSNIIGGVFFGLSTLLLAWFAVRPERDTATQVHPLRMLIAAGLVFTLCALVVTAMAVDGTDETSRGLAVVAATIVVPGTLAWWVLVVQQWRRGWRWSSSTTRGEMEAAKAEGTRVSPRRTDSEPSKP